MSGFEPLPPFRGTGEGREGDETTQSYAGWWTRVAAYVLDALMVAAVVLLVGLVVGHHLNLGHFRTVHGKRSFSFGRGALLGWTVFVDGLTFVYAVGLLASRWSATLGMRMCSIHLRTADGHRPTLGRVAGRTGVVVVAALLTGFVPVFFLALILDLLWPLWDASNQTLHDKIAGTVVMRGRVS